MGLCVLKTVRYLHHVRQEMASCPDLLAGGPGRSSGTWVTPTHNEMQSEQTARLRRFGMPGWVVTITISGRGRESSLVKKKIARANI